MTDTTEIINAIQVVCTFNRNAKRIAYEWVEITPTAGKFRKGANKARGSGGTVFEYLSREAPRLADAIHDFTYEIACPHLSVIGKNLAREEVAKTVLELV